MLTGISGFVSRVAVNRNIVSLEIYVDRIPYALSEGGRISGFECILFCLILSHRNRKLLPIIHMQLKCSSFILNLCTALCI